MLFLKDQVVARKSGGNLSTRDPAVTIVECFGDDVSQQITDGTQEDMEIPDPDEVGTADHNIPHLPARNTKRAAQQQLLDIEARKLQLLEKKTKKASSNDEDEAFFTSLLPHVRKLKAEDKLLFRTEIQNVLQKYAYKEKPFLNNPVNIDQEESFCYLHSTPTRSQFSSPLAETIQKTTLQSRVRHDNISTSRIEQGIVSNRNSIIVSATDAYH